MNIHLEYKDIASLDCSIPGSGGKVTSSCSNIYLNLSRFYIKKLSSFKFLLPVCILLLHVFIPGLLCEESLFSNYLNTFYIEKKLIPSAHSLRLSPTSFIDYARAQ